MAQKMTVALVDDLDGSPAAETVRFGFEGADYEIDLNAKHALALRRQLAPFTAHARRAGQGLARRAARTASRSASADGSRRASWSSTPLPRDADRNERSLR